MDLLRLPSLAEDGVTLALASNNLDKKALASSSPLLNLTYRQTAEAGSLPSQKLTNFSCPLAPAGLIDLGKIIYFVQIISSRMLLLS